MKFINNNLGLGLFIFSVLTSFIISFLIIKKKYCKIYMIKNNLKDKKLILAIFYFTVLIILLFFSDYISNNVIYIVMGLLLGANIAITSTK